MRDKFIEISLNDLIAKDILYQHDKGQVVRFVEEIGDGTLVLFNNSNVKEDAVPRYVENCSVEIPDRLLETDGSLIVTVKLVDSNSETTQKIIKIKIKSGSKQNEGIEPENQQTFIEQIQGIMTATKSIAEDVQERADNGEFDGFSPIATVIKQDNGVRVTIEDRNGITSEEVLNGENGFSPTIETEKVENKTKITITNKTSISETYINDGVVPVYNEESDYVVFKNAQQLEADGLISAIYGGEE